MEFGRGINVVGGRNAQGKTNLLEAVATLLLTRSPRASSSADVVAWGSDEALVEAQVLRPAADRTLAVRFRRDPALGRVTRTATVDGSPRPARDLLGLCPVVLFWPEDLQLVKAGPDTRRRLLDVVLSQLDRRAAADLLRYRHVLEQRNALLRQLRAGGADLAALAGFTRELVESGARIQVARAELVAALVPHGREALAQIGGGEELGLRYLPDGGMEPGGGLEAAEQALATTLARAPRRGDRPGRHPRRAAPRRPRAAHRRPAGAQRGVAGPAAKHRARPQTCRGAPHRLPRRRHARPAPRRRAQRARPRPAPRPPRRHRRAPACRR